MITPSMAEVALVALNAALRRERARDGAVRPLPIVLDTVTALERLAASTADVSGNGSFLGDPAPVVRPSYVDVHVAAQRLGITTRAVRYRCRSGTLSARKVGHSWAIEMETK